MKARAGRTIAASLVVAALVVLTPAAASAAPLPGAGVSASLPAAEPPVFNPSGSKWRGWIINVLGSVLGGATPNKLRAEQIANSYKYAASFEAMEAMLGIDGSRYNEYGELVGIKYSNKGTGTYTDVAIAGLEDMYKSNATARGAGPVRPPATPFKTFMKAAGAVGAVYMAYETGTALGSMAANGLSELGWFGYPTDANGLVCSYTAGLDGGIQTMITRSMTGQNCDMWDMHQDFVANFDAPSTLTFNGQTATFLRRWWAGGSNYYDCFKITGPGSTFPNVNTHQVSYRPGAIWIPGGRPSVQVGGPACAPTSGGYMYWGVEGGSGGPAVQLRIITNAGAVAAEAVGSDPDRHLDCTVRYTDGTSSTTVGRVFRESVGSAEPAVCPGTPDGKTPDEVEVGLVTDGVPNQTVYSEEVTDQYKDWWANFPECRNGSCELELFRLNPSPAVSCFDLDAGCPDWASDPNKSTNYECRYGVHDVALEECNVYAGLFQPGRIATGSPYSDPTSGQWSGGQNAPRSADDAMVRGVQDPDELRSCNFPNAFVDPVGAGIAAGQCLMEWTFVPSPVVVETAFAGAGEAWQGKPPQVIADAASGWALSPEATGCSRSASLFGISFNVLDTCDGPMAAIATVSRLVTGAGMLILVLVVLRRQVAGMVGYNQGQG